MNNDEIREIPANNSSDEIKLIKFSHKTGNNNRN